MTGNAPTARTGLALCRRVILGSVTHCWVPAAVQPVPLRGEGRGRGWPAASFARRRQGGGAEVPAARLGYQHGSGAGLLKPQIYKGATELGDKNSSPVHHRCRKDQSESFHPDSEVEDCRGTASAI